MLGRPSPNHSPPRRCGLGKWAEILETYEFQDRTQVCPPVYLFSLIWLLQRARVIAWRPNRISSLVSCFPALLLLPLCAAPLPLLRRSACRNFTSASRASEAVLWRTAVKSGRDPGAGGPQGQVAQPGQVRAYLTPAFLWSFGVEEGGKAPNATPDACPPPRVCEGRAGFARNLERLESTAPLPPLPSQLPRPSPPNVRPAPAPLPFTFACPPACPPAFPYHTSEPPSLLRRGRTCGACRPRPRLRASVIHSARSVRRRGEAGNDTLFILRAACLLRRARGPAAGSAPAQAAGPYPECCSWGVGLFRGTGSSDGATRICDLAGRAEQPEAGKTQAGLAQLP